LPSNGGDAKAVMSGANSGPSTRSCSPCPPSPSGTGGSSPGSRDTTIPTSRCRGSRVDAPRSLAGAALRLASADAVHDALAVVERLYRARRAALVLGLALGAGAWVLRGGGVDV
jgi:hypothetical protein